MNDPLAVRNARPDDLPGIMKVEEAWPEGQRAPEDKMASRLRRFPDGVFVAEAGERIVGVTTSCPMRLDPAKLEGFSSWDSVTNDGYLFDASEIVDANSIYIVSTGIVREFRHRGIFRKLISCQIALTRTQGHRYCSTGAILEGFAAYERDNPAASAVDYALKRVDGASIDPLVEKLRRLGFDVTSPNQVIPEYYASEDAHDWSALMILDLEALEGGSG